MMACNRWIVSGFGGVKSSGMTVVPIRVHAQEKCNPTKLITFHTAPNTLIEHGKEMISMR